MAQCGKLASLMVGATARLHTDQAWFQLRKERLKLRTPKGFVKDNFFTGGDPMNLENVLGQSNAYFGNLHGVAHLKSRF